MKNTRMSTAAVNIQADTLAGSLNNGYLRIYDTEQPADGDVGVDNQEPLVELRFAAVAAAPAAGGVITFAPLIAGTAKRQGTAKWYRTLRANGSTTVMDGSVGIVEDDPNLVLNSTTLYVGASVSVKNFTHTVNKSSEGV